MATLKDLLAQKEKLEAQIAETRQTEVAGVIQRIQELMAEYGLTVDDIAKRSRRGPKKGQPIAPKYRDPKTGKTWSGRGRQPSWLGRNPNRCLIAE